MGKNINNEIGKTYGCYKIIELLPIVAKEKRLCKCECIYCGSIQIKRYSDVKFHLIKHCPSCKKEYKIDEDLIGKKYGRLTIIGRGENHVQPNGSFKVTVDCLCDCGNKVNVLLHRLKTFHTTSCGCYHQEKLNEPKEILIGKKFGKLLVLSEINENVKRTTWLCKCDCGNETSATTSSLKTGRKQSCGCLISKAENDFKNFLNNNNYYFKSQYRIKECKDKRTLPFDFAIFKDSDYKDLLMLVELQGEQHYYPFTFNNESKEIKNKNLQNRIRKDNLKRQYCKDNNIPLLEVKYFQFENMENVFMDFLSNLKSENIGF